MGETLSITIDKEKLKKAFRSKEALHRYINEILYNDIPGALYMKHKEELSKRLGGTEQ